MAEETSRQAGRQACREQATNRQARQGRVGQASKPGKQRGTFGTRCTWVASHRRFAMGWIHKGEDEEEVVRQQAGRGRARGTLFM